MKLVTYSNKDGAKLGAVLSDSSVLDLAAASRRHYMDAGIEEGRAEALARETLGRNMVEFLEAGEVAMSLARAVVAGAEKSAKDSSLRREATAPRSSVRLLAPVPKPGKVIGIGGNYPLLKSTWPVAPGKPPIFQKARSCIVGPEDPVILPKRFVYVQPELELVLIIGKKCHAVAQKDVWDVIAGYTIGNDLSAIDSIMGNWVTRKRPDIGKYGLPTEAPYNFGIAFESKSFDTFGPIGPYLVTRDEVDATKLQLTLRINGEVIQEGNTRDMVVTIPAMVEFISSVCTLEPGDVIFSGALNHLPPLKVGDKMEHEIEGLGKFTTVCQAEAA